MNTTNEQYAAINLHKRLSVSHKQCEVVRLDAPIDGLSWGVRLDGWERPVYVVPDGDKLRLFTYGAPFIEGRLHDTLYVSHMREKQLFDTIGLSAHRLFAKIKRMDML